MVMFTIFLSVDFQKSFCIVDFISGAQVLADCFLVS